MNLVIDGNRHPATRHFEPLFDTGQLPPELAAVAEPFVVCARATVDQVSDGPELSVALRKLLEAKDAAVRAALTGRPGPRGLPVDDALTAAARQGAAGSGLAARD